MVQGVKNDLSEWLKNTVEDYVESEKKWLLRRIKYMYEKHGPEVEKKIFKYIARYVMGRVNPPKFIDGLPIFFPPWTSLSRAYVKRKKHNRKYLYSGNFIRYLEAKNNAQYWYRAPQTKVNYKEGTVSYYSMFREGRKAFTANDYSKSTAVPFEEKLSKNEAEGRPIVEYMENFLLYRKLSKVMDEQLKRILEEDYENEQLIPTAGEL